MTWGGLGDLFSLSFSFFVLPVSWRAGESKIKWGGIVCKGVGRLQHGIAPMGLRSYPQVQKQRGAAWTLGCHLGRLSDFSNRQVGGRGWAGEKGITLMKIKTSDIYHV